MTTTVLLATFASPWISEAIDSVRRQSRGDWELLVLDDARDVDTQRLVAELDDDRIRYMASPKTLGPALNHQRGIEAASNDRIAIINHDDVWEPQLLEELERALDACPEAVVAFGDHWVIDASGCVDEAATGDFARQWGRASLAPGAHKPFKTIAIVDRAIPVAQSAVWRKSTIRPIPEWAGDRYDFWIAIALSQTAGVAIYVPHRLARFRLHDSNLGGSASLYRRCAAVSFYYRLLREFDFGGETLHLRSLRRHAIGHLIKWPAAVVSKPVRHRYVTSVCSLRGPEIRRWFRI